LVVTPDTPSGDKLLATPAGVALGPLDQIADGAARGFVLEIAARRFHGFVVRSAEAVHGFVDRCPHMGVPLAHQLDDYMAPYAGLIACGWHGALFRVEGGLCVAGPCKGARLLEWPVEVVNGLIRTA
jgi:nitrite reductase/ring-hydroxylating ferredoxin subunit